VSADFLYFHPCELIITFVVGISSMTLEPLPIDAVPGRDLIKLSPQVIIFNRLAVCSAPVIGFPTL